MIDMLNFVLTNLHMTKRHWPRIARESGVSVRTIRKVASGEIASPHIHTLQPLADYFAAALVDTMKARARIERAAMKAESSQASV